MVFHVRSIPSFPKVLDGKGVESIPLQEWKTLTIAIRIWSSLESETNANLVDQISSHPSVQIDEELLDFFNKDEMDLDKTLGLHI